MQKKPPQLAEIAELKFRPLKKGLQQSFKNLSNSIERNKLPDPKTLDRFLDEVSLMVSYPGFGDEFYGAFQEACLTLLNFHRANDIEGFSNQIASIQILKKLCHNRLK